VKTTYDGTTAATLGAGNYTLSSLVGSDAVTTVGSAAYDTADAGTNKTVTATGLTLSGTAAGSYVLASASNSAATIGMITQTALTVTANDAGKPYDQQAFTGGNGGSYSGFVANETSTVLGGSLVCGGSAQGAVNASRYGITLSGLSSGNYAIA
jgi:hypothetical protein